MTKIKFCGLTRVEDIEVANELTPEFVGFVFAEKSRRYVSIEQAATLKNILSPKILSVGVFVNADIKFIAEIAERRIIDAIQLHGNEDENYIAALRTLTKKIIIKAFKITSDVDLTRAENSTADYILLDGGAGDGKTFDWHLLKNFYREYLGGFSHTPNSAFALSIIFFAVILHSYLLYDKSNNCRYNRATHKPK